MSRSNAQVVGTDHFGRYDVDHLCDAYVRPLEGEHRGKYVAITADGQVLVAAPLLDAARKASAEFSAEHVIFKVGDRVVGKIR